MPLPGSDGQVLQQNRSQPAALIVVAHREGDLGIGGGESVVAADPDDLTGDRGDDRHPVVVVDMRETAHVLLVSSG